MKKDNLEEYYDFFLEVLPIDYLSDIEIQDEYDKPNDDPTRGLSDEQVSQIAQDSLRDAGQPDEPSQPEPDPSN